MCEALQKYTKIKNAVEKAQADASKAEGALSEVMKTLKNEFGCANLKQAMAKAQALEAKTNAAKSKFEEALASFEDEWGSML